MLEPDEMALLRTAVERHEPQLAQLLDAIGTRHLTVFERDGLRVALEQELVERGIDDRDERVGDFFRQVCERRFPHEFFDDEAERLGAEGLRIVAERSRRKPRRALMAARPLRPAASAAAWSWTAAFTTAPDRVRRRSAICG